MNKSPLFFSVCIIAMIFCNISYGKGTYYDIGGHRKIYMECAGSGKPVVLLIAGLKDRGDYSFDYLDSGSQSPTVFSAVSKFTTVCMYDRPGTLIIKNDDFEMSRSTPVKQPITVNDQVKDLEALIRVANIQKPFIIVAHSAGGLIARMYAYKHTKDLVGLMLLDVTTEDLKDKWDRKEWTIFDYSSNVLLDEKLYQHKELEWLDFNLSFYQMQKAMGIGRNRIKLRIPHVVVLSADKTARADEVIKMGFWPDWVTQATADDIIKNILLSQDELASSFNPPAKHIKKTNSGHKIQSEQPQLVIDEIKAMVDENRARSPQ